MTRYSEIIGRVREAATGAGRSPDEVTLVAVSKTKSVDDIKAVYDLGHRDFGENRAQEMAAKAPLLPADIRWHFVGSLQTNKVRMIRSATSLLHSVDRESLAKAWVKGSGMPPPVLLQVNVADEQQKSGVAASAVPELLSKMVDLGLSVRGLMAIPPIPESPEDGRAWFEKLRRIADLVDGPPGWEGVLSMGMTDDFEVAIEEGSSIIRVGRAIFGPRE